MMDPKGTILNHPPPLTGRISQSFWWVTFESVNDLYQGEIVGKHRTEYLARESAEARGRSTGVALLTGTEPELGKNLEDYLAETGNCHGL